MEFELISGAKDFSEIIDGQLPMEGSEALFTTMDWSPEGGKDQGSRMTSAGVDEEVARTSRELDRKAEEERLLEQRAKAEVERLQALQKDAARQEEERLRSVADEEQRKEEIARQLSERREEEERVREQMQQEMNLGQQHGAQVMLDDI